MAHIQHLLEDRDLPVHELESIISLAASGNLSDVSEKLDGVNIVFTCTPKYEVRFARSDSDIRNGGMIGAVLEAKYVGRGLVQDTFVNGSAALRSAVRALPPADLVKAFDGGRLWYSAEIIYTKNPNVVQYAQDAIVLHKRPVLRVEGNSVVVAAENGFSYLEKWLPDMTAPGWAIHGPQNVTLSKLPPRPEVGELKFHVNNLCYVGKTLRDCLRVWARDDLERMCVSGSTLDAAVERLVEAPGCQSLTTLRSKLPSRAAETLRNSSTWSKNQLRDLDFKLTRFAGMVLEHVKSNLVLDHDVERARIIDKLNESCALIEKSYNPVAISLMEEQLGRLAGQQAYISPVEGIVFPWKDKLYKLTGAFAPANAIIGLVKYGRGKAVPPLGA